MDSLKSNFYKDEREGQRGLVNKLTFSMERNPPPASWDTGHYLPGDIWQFLEGIIMGLGSEPWSPLREATCRVHLPVPAAGINVCVGGGGTSRATRVLFPTSICWASGWQWKVGSQAALCGWPGDQVPLRGEGCSKPKPGAQARTVETRRGLNLTQVAPAWDISRLSWALP